MAGEDGGQAFKIASELVVPDLFDLVAYGQVSRFFQLKGFAEYLSFVIYLKGLLLGFLLFLHRRLFFRRVIPEVFDYSLQVLSLIRVNQVYLADFCLPALLNDGCQFLSKLLLLQSLELIIYNHNKFLS